MTKQAIAQNAPDRVSARGTQSLVDIIFRCWRRPSLTALEILWRWLYGIPMLWLLHHYGLQILAQVPVEQTGLQHFDITNPMHSADVVANAALLWLPPALDVAKWLVPVLLAGWAVASGLGRTLVLYALDKTLHRKPFTLIALQLVRILALASSFALWFLGLQWASRVAVSGPLLRGLEPNLVQYFAIAIVLSLGLFSLWALVSWIFSAAPLLAALKGTGVWSSLRATFQLGALRGKLIEINLVMGIVKIALIVLAMVFSATPLPFETVATAAFLHWWWVLVSILYFAATDFFHVARLTAYLALWRLWNPAG